MNKFLESYNKERSFISKASHRLWVAGETISILFVVIYALKYQKIVIPLILWG